MDVDLNGSKVLAGRMLAGVPGAGTGAFETAASARPATDGGVAFRHAIDPSLPHGRAPLRQGIAR